MSPRATRAAATSRSTFGFESATPRPAADDEAERRLGKAGHRAAGDGDRGIVLARDREDDLVRDARQARERREVLLEAVVKPGERLEDRDARRRRGGSGRPGSARGRLAPAPGERAAFSGGSRTTRPVWTVVRTAPTAARARRTVVRVMAFLTRSPARRSRGRRCTGGAARFRRGCAPRRGRVGKARDAEALPGAEGREDRVRASSRSP